MGERKRSATQAEPLALQRRVLTVYITAAEDEILDRERRRRLARGGRRRGNTENSSLIREAIRIAFGDPE